MKGWKMMYNDNRETVEADPEVQVHNLRYKYDPSYKASYDYNVAKQRWNQENDAPIEDASIDASMIFGPAARGTVGLMGSIAKGGGRRIAKLGGASDIGFEKGRRDAMKTMGVTGVGLGAIGKEAMPSIMDIVTQGTKKAIQPKSTGINLAELGEKATKMQDIVRATMFNDNVIPHKGLQAMKLNGQKTAIRLADKYKYVYPDLYKADFHRAAGSSSRFELPKKVSDEMDRLMAAGDKGVIKDRAELEEMNKYYDTIDDMRDSIGEMKDIRDIALSSDKPVLDLPSLKSELLRTRKRIAETNKAPARQKQIRYERDEADRPTGKSDVVDVVNESKQIKLDYLTRRENALMNQLDHLSKTGKIEKELKIPKKSSMKDSDYVRINRNPRIHDVDLYDKVLDYGPF